jgi:hypothetical protein
VARNAGEASLRAAITGTAEVLKLRSTPALVPSIDVATTR